MKPPYADKLDTFLNGTEMNARYERDNLQKLAAELYAMGLRDGKAEMQAQCLRIANKQASLPRGDAHDTGWVLSAQGIWSDICALPLEDTK